MKVLVACEFSGTVRDAFARRGHYAVSCDLEPSESIGPHYQGDVRDILYKDWDLVIAHPPCTYLCNSGVMYFHHYTKAEHTNAKRGDERYAAMRDGAEFFNLFQDLPCMVAIENPIPHKYAKELIGEYDQRVNPSDFGHPYTKSVCLWLKDLPLLICTMQHFRTTPHCAEAWKRNPRNHKARSADRSRTFQGIADAMAHQWGCLD